MENIICLGLVALLFTGTCESKEISSFDINLQVPAEKVEVKEHLTSELVLKNASEWHPDQGRMINLPLEPCETKDSLNQVNFAELLYLNMHPPCEETSKKGYCGIRRHQNITLISKFLTKHHNQQFRVRVHLVDKIFKFETAVWPEFGACQPFFNITCPHDEGLVHSLVLSEVPKEIPAISTIVRVRLISVNEGNKKNVAICRQIKLNVI